MIDELKARLTALGMGEEMATKAIAAVADFAKSKAPSSFHSAIDDVLANPLFPASGLATGSLNGLNPKSKFLAFNPLFPASGLATGSLNGLNPKSKFLAFWSRIIGKRV